MMSACSSFYPAHQGGQENQRLPPPLFAASSLRACTFNANGLSTLVPHGTGQEQRYLQVAKFFRREKLHVMGLQEPHIPTHELNAGQAAGQMANLRANA